MQKLAFTFIFCLTYFFSLSNPIVLPEVYISELFCDNGNWTLEFYIIDPDNLGGYIEWIEVETYSGTATYTPTDPLEITNHLIFPITNDSLDIQMQINPVEENLTITTYGHIYVNNEFSSEDALSIGDQIGSNIGELFPDQSVSRHFSDFGPSYSVNYYKDNSPTLGLPNDLDGAYAEMRGYIYNNENEPVANSQFHLIYMPEFYTNSTGFYTSFVISGKKTFDRIYYKSNNTNHSLWIENLSIETEPEEIIIQNIYINTAIPTSIEEKFEGNNQIKTFFNYPNPVRSSTIIYYDIPSSLKYISAEIEFADNLGRTVYRKDISNTRSDKFEFTTHNIKSFNSGIIHYFLVIDGEIYKKNSMLIVK